MPQIPRRYDVLIVDEVHNCAPAGGQARNATRATRFARRPSGRLPHTVSTGCSCRRPRTTAMTTRSSALLELLDPHRFARGIKPAPERPTREVTVRRLKQDLLNDDGTPQVCPPRRIVKCSRSCTPKASGTVHAQLVAYATARARPAPRHRREPVGERRGGFRRRRFSRSGCSPHPPRSIRTLRGTPRHAYTARAPRRRRRRPATVLQTIVRRRRELAGRASANEDGVGEAAREAIRRGRGQRSRAGPTARRSYEPTPPTMIDVGRCARQ